MLLFFDNFISCFQSSENFEEDDDEFLNEYPNNTDSIGKYIPSTYLVFIDEPK